MNIKDNDLPGVKLVEPQVFPDERGFFQELFRADMCGQLGSSRPFVQFNTSVSRRNVLRGLHYQVRVPQAKLVTVLRGEVFDVAVDIRRGSPTFGRWSSVILSESNHLALYVPEGYAHGFCALTDETRLFYMTTAYYTPGDDRGIVWSDPDLAIPWPVANPVLNHRDALLPRLRDAPQDSLPSMGRVRDS